MEEKKTGFINYGVVNDLITKVEKMLDEEELDIVEKSFVVSQIQARIKVRQSQKDMGDLMSNAPLGGILGRVTKKLMKSEE